MALTTQMAAAEIAGPKSALPASEQATVRAAALRATPRGFIPNVGQSPDEGARFILRGAGVTAYFTDRGFVWWNGKTTSVLRDGVETRVPVAARWELVGARPVQPMGGDTYPHTVSFFRGNDPARWRANVPAYRELRYPEIHDGVEMRVASRDDGFEYSFRVAPHAKPDLRFRYEGILGLERSPDGDLVVRTVTGSSTESRPVAFQWIEGTRREVTSSFEVLSAEEYRIALGSYDERFELVVDPVLDWSTSVGGSYNEHLTVVNRSFATGTSFSRFSAAQGPNRQ